MYIVLVYLPVIVLESVVVAAVDSDYQLSSDEDVEDTIEEQENVEGEVDHAEEMNDLMEEGLYIILAV